MMDSLPHLHRTLRLPSFQSGCVPALALTSVPLFSYDVQSTCPQSTRRAPHRVCQRRFTHGRRHVSSAAMSLPKSPSSAPPASASQSSTCMSWLPLSTLLRSYLITSVSSIPLLLRPSLATLEFLANSKSRFLNPDVNPLLRLLLKKTFYAQFCAGETPSEVRQTLQGLKDMGFKGVIMGHAREVVLSKDEESDLNKSLDCAEQEQCNNREIAAWTKSTVDTIALAQKGDFVSLKFTGAGRQALQRLKETIPCAPEFEKSLHTICRAAEKQEISLLIDAEQASLQQGIDNWTTYLMRLYNKGDRALVYGTYQAYAKRTPGLLAKHLEEGVKDNFVVGVKLVRGAYLGSDPRELFWETAEGTHNCYDNIAECILRRQYAGLLKPVDGALGNFPKVDLVLASHNSVSVERARKVRDEQVQMGVPRIRLAYGQLMGMADNVSCELVQAARERSQSTDQDKESPQAYKYVVWGSLGECMKYLLRRAYENKDAVSRTITARQALGKEIARRLGISR